MRLVYLLILCSAAWLAGCHQPEPIVTSPATPSQPVVSPPASMPGEAPRILRFSVEGIPDDHIQINQDTREIHVLIPTQLSGLSLPASFTITDGYTWTYYGNTQPYRFLVNDARAPIQLYVKGDPYSQSAGKPYQLTTSAEGPLEITSPPASLSFETGSVLLLQIKNYYDDATKNELVITNQSTGQQFTGYISSCNTAIPACQGGSVGAFFVFFTDAVPVGTYAILLRKDNQRQATASLRVNKGVPTGYYDTYNPPTPGAQNLVMRGYNLFASDQVELLLRNRTGESYTITPSAYADDGRSLTFSLPASIKPSQYGLQFKRMGQPVASFGRLIISQDRSQPAIVLISDAAYTTNSDTPLVLARTQRYPLQFVLAAQVVSARMKLTPENSSLPTRLIDLNNTQAYLLYGPDGGVPNFTLPADMSPGRYVLRLQYTLGDQRVLEGEPYERFVDVR